MAIETYGWEWPTGATQLEIEMSCIRQSLHTGFPLTHHYEQMRKILWPRLADHRWHRLIMENIINHKCTVLAGPASSGKTHEAAWLFLCEYMVFPHETCVLVSSTDIRGLRGRVWSEITQLWQEARDVYPWLPGNLLDSKVAILTDALDEDQYEKRARNYRKCIQGVPCRESGSWVGINRYAGWKQKRMRLVADEASQMEQEYIKGITNLNANPDFKCVILGNFADPMDCLGRCAEPRDGWNNHMSPMKTEVWETFYPLKGVCVNLIGFDSPNFDYPKAHPDEPDKFPYLIGQKRISEIEASFGRQSSDFMSQCWGAMKISQLSHRILNREMCQAGKAFEDVDWHGELTRIGFLDSSWGGDRCVFTHGCFGKSVDGLNLLKAFPPEIVPMKGLPGTDPDMAMAEWTRDRCNMLGIPPENFGHDSTGRGSLGTALARAWSSACNPIEFGGLPTNRPVSEDMNFLDPKTGQYRQRLCHEHYIKFVTELWFSVHYCVVAGQLRGLCEDVFEEFALRIWKMKGDKREVEPKSGTREKPGMKQRTGRSPDLADSLAGLVEMARRRGFQIKKLDNPEGAFEAQEWMRKMAAESKQHWEDGQLQEV